ncbi:MAG: patatin-like phospholipase family protein [Smithella sp.]
MGKGVKKQDKNSSYVAGNSEDPIYFGAQKVINAELKLISKRKGKEITETNNLAGLALSGGGIRSASFSLGIMQALAYKNWLSKIDYLSTVSGGGYIGTSLTWLLSKKWKLKDGSPIPFDTSPKNFPYVTYPMCGKEYGKQADVSLPGVSLVKWIEDSISKDVRGKLLHYLRQNAQYLTPGGGINIFSLIAVLLRGIALGLVTYFALCVLLFLFLNKFKFLCVPPDLNCFLLIASLVLATYLVTLPLYSLGTYFFRRTKNRAYLMRRGYEKLAGFLLPLALALAVVGSIPFISGWLDKSLNSDTLKRIYSSITGTDIQATGVSVISIIIGVISSIAAFFKTNKVKASKIPIGLFAGVGAAALLFGILILAYQASLAILVIPILFPVNVAAILSFLVVILALVVNLNHVSVHRYYRDRLMETFMPDVASILADNYERSHKTEEANAKRLHEMCGNEGNTKYSGPYHIINTNVVLASAKRAKFRGRGGDNFIMSPLYCGGNATGWLKTEKYMGGEMTLASAMAISGAAVNPDAGGGGDGITRQPFLSILMGMLNLRLGYWVPNPDPQKSKGMLKPPVPNYFWPGLWEIIFRYRLNEKAYFLQLTDGGHFENLALYEMIRRRLKLIIVCDGAVDPQYTFSELANAMQKVRTDFGALIIINNEDLKDLTPSQEINQVKVAKKGFLKAKIVYADNSKGRLIYINTTFCEGLSTDLYGYKREHPSFPEEPTSDQFFNEKQFEAYRELGYHIAWSMMKDDEVISDPIVKEVMEI